MGWLQMFYSSTAKAIASIWAAIGELRETVNKLIRLADGLVIRQRETGESLLHENQSRVENERLLEANDQKLLADVRTLEELLAGAIRRIDKIEEQIGDPPPPQPGEVFITITEIEKMSSTLTVSLPEKSADNVKVASVALALTKADGSTIYDGDVTANSPDSGSGERGSLVIPGTDLAVGDVIHYRLIDTDSSGNASAPSEADITLISSDQDPPATPGVVTAVLTPE